MLFLLYVHCTWGHNFSHLPHRSIVQIDQRDRGAYKHTHARHHHNSFHICFALELAVSVALKIFVMANGAHNYLLIYCHLTSCTKYICSFCAHENHLSIISGICWSVHFAARFCPKTVCSLNSVIWLRLFKTQVEMVEDMKNIYCDS